MNQLIRLGKQKLLTEYPDFPVYSVNIFTDPDWAFSAISFDDAESSHLRREEYLKELEKSREYSRAAGDTEQLERLYVPVRSHYHGGIEALHRLVEVDHESFTENWQYEPGNRCWETLEPLLKQIASVARRELADLKLHDDAEISVNGRASWSQYILAFKQDIRQK